MNSALMRLVIQSLKDWSHNEQYSEYINGTSRHVNTCSIVITLIAITPYVRVALASCPFGFPCARLLDRIAVTYVDADYCYRPSSVVCLSVCRFVAVVGPAQTAEPMQTPFGLWARVGSRWELRSPHGKEQF